MNMNMNVNVNTHANLLALYEFPPASPCLDASRLDALRLVYTQLEAVDLVPLLVDHLTRRAGETTGRTRLGCRLAASVVPWWRLDRRGRSSPSSGSPSRLPTTRACLWFWPRDISLTATSSGPSRSWTEPTPSRTPLAREFDRLRTVISERLRTGTPDQLVELGLAAT